MGTLCVSPDLLRQLVSTLISLRPQHVTDRIMSLNPAGVHGVGGSGRSRPCPRADKCSHVQNDVVICPSLFPLPRSWDKGEAEV